MARQSSPYRALPDDDFRFTLGLERGAVGEYFAGTSEHEELISARQQKLQATPERYFGLLPVGSEIAADFCDWAVTSQLARDCVLADSVEQRFQHISSQLEPDVVLVQPDALARPIAVGGCVCFPSAWSLPEKLGLTVTEIHAVVPGLNAALEPRIDRLLCSLKSGDGWLRSNWGVAATSERDLHPAHCRIPWPDALQDDSVWIRREHQILFRLPKSGGIVFGIRLELTSLAEILQDPEACRRWARGLATMPRELLQYKQALSIREAVLERLRSTHADSSAKPS